jgi:tripartite-type tricarboxylate transporter receptor subunit TctC
MFRITIAAFSALGLATLLTPSAFAADTYPDKPIRLIVPFAPGGASDVTARALSDKLSENMGTTIIIDNRGGAGGTRGAALAAQAAPDGYTLLFTSASYTFTPSIYKNLPYDPIKDFKPITMFTSIPNVLVVHPSMPVKNTGELLALARKRPGEIHYSSGGRGSNIHLTSALFEYMARIKLAHVPYKGGGPGQIALMSGEVEMMLPAITPALPFVKSGRMRGIAVSSKQRAPVLPQLPTINESGVPGYVKTSWFALFAPAAVPQHVIDRVYQASVKALKNPEIVKRLANQGAEAVGNSSAEFSEFVRDEINAWAKLIREMKL